MEKTLLKISLLALFFVSFSLKAFDSDTLYLCKGSGVTYTSKGNGVAWQWTFQAGKPGTSNAKNPGQVNYDTAGIFLTTIKTTFADGTDTTDYIRVVVYDSPIQVADLPRDTSYCSGTNFSLILKTLDYPGAKYLWSTGATSSSITVNTKGTYWVEVVLRASPFLCDSVRKSINIDEIITPTVNLGQDKTMCQNQLIILDGGTGTGLSYLWSPNGEVTRTINVTLPGIYKVRVTRNPCFAEDEVEMIDSCPHNVFVPNAVSPNEDRLNDLFVKVWNFTPKNYTFSIYNRWGELIFETEDINAGWDCKVNDDLVCQDIYVYKIVYQDGKKWFEMRGTFFVVR